MQRHVDYRFDHHRDYVVIKIAKEGRLELKKRRKTTDDEILHSLESIVEGIAKMYGEYTEVVLHRLDASHSSVIKIENGHVTGREIAASITSLALLKIKNGNDVCEPCIIKTKTGKILRSITIVVRNLKKTPIGFLCINFDLNAPMQSFLEPLFSGHLPSKDAFLSPENFTQNMDETIESAIENAKEEVWNEKSISPSKRNREIVTKLNDFGIFKYKDSVLLVAKVLEISKDTVYLYLRETEKK